MEEEKKSPLPVKQIFVNDVHTYVSKHVAQVRGGKSSPFRYQLKSRHLWYVVWLLFLPGKIIGQIESPEESDDDDSDDEMPSPRDEPAFQVVGTSINEEKVQNVHQVYVVSRLRKGAPVYLNTKRKKITS